MRKRWTLTIASTAFSALAAVLSACANDGGTSDAPSEERNTPVPAPALDGGEASDAADAGACDDCELFPTECTPDALCAAALFSNSSTPTTLDPRTHVHALTGRAPDDLWLAGTSGAIARFDGTAWRRSNADVQNSFYGLWLRDDAEVAFDDPKRLYTRGLDAGTDASADGWSLFPAVTVHSAWGNSFMRVETTWAAPGSRSLFIGATTQGTRGGLWRMRYSSESNAFTFDPLTLDKCTTLPCKEVYGLHGLSGDEVWAVGPRGAAFRVTDAESDTPTLTGFNTQTVYALHGVWAAAENDVWAVGATGTVRRYRGDARFWESYDEIPTQEHLYAVAGTSPSDIWVAGEDAIVFHYDGAAWTRVKVAGLDGRRPRFDRIWIAAPGKVWVAGQGAIVSLGGKR
ncbi:MAG: hypothetical protein J0I07_26805 [Myxococcales bacterium]|nr:hypothetical protein [Myxococcales bacterium]